MLIVNPGAGRAAQKVLITGMGMSYKACTAQFAARTIDVRKALTQAVQPVANRQRADESMTCATLDGISTRQGPGNIKNGADKGPTPPQHPLFAPMCRSLSELLLLGCSAWVSR